MTSAMGERSATGHCVITFMQIHTAHHRRRAMPQLIGCIPDYGIIHSIISRECIVHRSIVENGKCN